MGTKFRTLLAPIGVSTGDGRRFASGAITLAPVPLPLEWARSREMGHDGAVQVGVVQQATVATVGQAVADRWISAEAAKASGLSDDQEAVWGTGELFDDASREDMPRLAEDVAEAMHLIQAGTLGPSVDLDSFEAMPVLEGSDEPLDWETVEAIYEETGEEPAIELLVTEGRVRAATLVSIPAFAETSRPLELVAAEPADGEGDDTEADPEAASAHVVALIASVATVARPAVAAFTMPELDGLTPITWDWDNGRVFGHIAPWAACHVGYPDMCVTPPRDADGSYAWFNRHAVETEDGGTIFTGRITVGGRHAGLALSASGAMAEYDGKTVAAHVRAYEDAHGIVVAGVIEPGLTASERAVLDRRKVSGDWRETAAGLSLVEVLALSPGPRQHSEPGFPVETFSRGGRQVALTASFGIEGARTRLKPVIETIDVQAAVRTELARREAAAALSAALESDQAAHRSDARRALAAVMGEQEG